MLRADSLHATCLHVHMRACLYAYMLTCVHAYMHLRTCLHAYMFLLADTRLCFYMLTCIHAYMRPHVALHSTLFSLDCHISTHLLNYSYVQKRTVEDLSVIPEIDKWK